MNTNQIKKAIDTPEIHSLVGSYLLARTFAETVRADVDKVYAEILNDIPVYSTTKYGEPRERITDHNQLYNSEGDLGHIYDEMDKRLKDAKVKPADMDHDFCPALVAEDELRKIKRVIADVSGKPLNISADTLLCSADGLKNYDKWIDLVVGAIVNSPNFKKPRI